MANQGDKRREDAVRATVDLAEIDANSAGTDTKPRVPARVTTGLPASTSVSRCSERRARYVVRRKDLLIAGTFSDDRHQGGLLLRRVMGAFMARFHSCRK